MQPTAFIWQNGVLEKWPDAKVHVMAHGLHYGSTVFEGIRSYDTENGPAIFRLGDHIRRLFDSCKMYRMSIRWTEEEIEAACCEVICANKLTDAYIRPIVYCDVGSLGLAPLENGPMGVAIGAFVWESLLGSTALKNGSHVCVSSWTRPQSSSNPMMAKAGGHYLTSQLITREARLNGYDEGIAVNRFGNITEGSSSNLFVLKNGQIATPPLSCSILEGITRDAVMQIARREGFEVVESNILREYLYVADEVWLCGTAAEVTPVVSIDRIPIGAGNPGTVTCMLQQRFAEMVRGRYPAPEGWLTHAAQVHKSRAQISMQQVKPAPGRELEQRQR